MGRVSQFQILNEGPFSVDEVTSFELAIARSTPGRIQESGSSCLWILQLVGLKYEASNVDLLFGSAQGLV